MLLRLLPTPSPSQPSPPTILFTLPLPNSPYTSRALPLPANLLAHRSLCLQEDIDCTNVLLGDKATWISGVVDNVTFSLPHQTILVHLVDGTSLNLDLSPACIETLARVVHEVQLSFAAASKPPPPVAPEAAPRPSAEVAGASGRRSPGSLLFSLLSPLLPAPPKAQPAHQPARAHRRAARSLLVDAYRRHVLPALKRRMPSAYLMWAIQSETGHKMDEFTALKNDINHLLDSAGVVYDLASSCGASSRSRASTMSSASSESSSRCSVDESSSAPQSLLLAIPPAHTLPPPHRPAYSAQLARLSELASRVGSISRLAARYEREEDKRRWLDQVDLERDADKAVRRAMSNGLLPARVHAAPLRPSPLRESVVASELDEPLPPAPVGLGLRHLERIDESVFSDDDSDDDMASLEADYSDRSTTASPEPVTPRPEDEPETPDLVPSRSDDSLSEREWDVDVEALIAPLESSAWVPMRKQPSTQPVLLPWPLEAI